MTYTLHIGDRLFSSWSLRGWLMLEKFGVPYTERLVGLYTGTLARDLAPLAPARFVPVLETPDGIVVGETLAMAETLAEAHPDAGYWPADRRTRAFARWICAEMASGFQALRSDCPMQLAHVWQGFTPSAATARDLARIETVWATARSYNSGEQSWLLGAYSLADVFYAPVAARIIGYDLPVSSGARRYCEKVISDPAFREWRAEGLKVTYDPFPYTQQLEHAPWPDTGAH